jgi:LemA protein
MDLGTEIIMGIVAVVIIILVGIFFVIYNGLITLSNNVKKAWADIDVLLQKRHDLIPNLVETVSSYAKYEKGVMTQVTSLRSAWQNIKPDDIQGKIDTSNQITTALKSVFAVAENYPDLKANQNFLSLQQSLSDIETQIADRREFYNNAVNDFNIRIQQIPYNIFAGMMHFIKQPLFSASEEEEQPVQVKFDL